MKNDSVTKGKIAIISLIALSFISLVVVGYFVYANNALANNTKEERSLQLVNQIRKDEGVSPLSWNNDLEQAAQAKVNDIISKRYFEHTSPTGEKAWDLVLESGYPYVFAGENLAIDYDSIGDAVNAWKKSPSHLSNIASDKFEDYGFAQGIGDVEGHTSKVYVQMFATEENSLIQFVSFENNH